MARLELQNGGIFPENYSRVEVPTLARLRAFIPGNTVTLTSATLERLL